MSEETAGPHDAETLPVTPLVSVLTPSFNQGQWIADNIRSVAAQTYPRVEHIIADGGSTDGTIEIIKRTADASVSWNSEPDAGQSDAINKAFVRARGEIIGWLNSDDAYFSADTVALAVRAFTRHPEVDVVYGHAALVNSDGLVLQVSWAPPMWDWLLPLHNFVIQPTAFIRRSALGERLVDPELAFMMDRDLWRRLAPNHRFRRIDRILAIDRHQPDRKVLTRQDLAAADEARLGTMRPTVRAAWVRPARKLFKVAFRWVGLACVREATQTRYAYDGWVDSVPSLLMRQAFVPRARMPLQRKRPGPSIRAGA
jgi:glycosyltransferase involved in cell wall biosynthesis